MATDVEVGSFALKTGATGSQVVSLSGSFTPKAIIFWWNQKIADGSDNDDAVIGFGVAASSTERAAVCTEMNTTDAVSAHSNAHCIYRVDNTDTVQESADLTSFGAGQFTLDVDDTGLALIINYLALGGSSLTNAGVFSGAVKSTTGTQAYTGDGATTFTPDCAVLFGSYVDSALPDIMGGNGGLGVGFALSTTERGSASAGDSFSNTGRIQEIDECIMFANGSASPIGYEADFSTFDNAAGGGITLDFGVANAANGYVSGLLLKGITEMDISNYSSPTSTGNNAETGVGFEPQAQMFISFNNAASAATISGARLSIGAADATNEGCVWMGSNTGYTNADSNLDRTKCLKHMAEGGPPTVDESASLVSFDSDGMTLDWQGSGISVAREYIVFSIGDAAAGGPTITDVNTTESWDDGDTGLVITGTGFV